MTGRLFPTLCDPPSREALRVEGRALTYPELAGAVAGVAGEVAGMERVAVWAEPALETCVAVLGGLAAGVAVVPINPKIGEHEFTHIVGDSRPSAMLCADRVELPAGAAELARMTVDLTVHRDSFPDEPPEGTAALVLYTSGTTGPPKGVVLSRRSIGSNLDALARVWDWTPADVLVQGLPLFHAHGLALGVLGPLRVGGRLHHVGRFSPEAVSDALGNGGTMLFAVPTMYRRLADAAEGDASIAAGLGSARLLVSGSAALPAREHTRIENLTGLRVVERYGLTETLMNCAVPSGRGRPGTVGLPLPGVEVRLVDDGGETIEASDGETIGEVVVRGPNLFSGYLNRPDATAVAMRDGWFFTGDLATRAPDGFVSIVGRRATDLIKTGGFKIGAGEIEGALLEHPSVAEAAVTGEPDDDLGERIVAWVVLHEGAAASDTELADHVASLLSPHKRPRIVRFTASLPRNEMGKIKKAELR